MKKKLLILFVLLTYTVVFWGCSENSSNNKKEEETTITSNSIDYYKCYITSDDDNKYHIFETTYKEEYINFLSVINDDKNYEVITIGFSCDGKYTTPVYIVTYKNVDDEVSSTNNNIEEKGE